jgi:signal transduction histidine kinase
MLKNSEIKKLFLVITICFIFFLIGSFFITNIIINNYRNYFLDYNAKVINIIEEKYPKASGEVIDLIINSNNPDKKVLEDYGIKDPDLINKINNLSIQYNKVLTTNILFVSFVFLIIFIVITIFINRLYKKIRKLSNYTLDILENKSKLDIVDNSEGELSILRNRLYDITRLLKENNLLLEKEKLYLKQALADISHQIKTPLTSLYLLNEIISKEKDSKKRNLFIDKMKDELERIEWLVSSLLKISKIDSGTIVFKEEKVNINNLINLVYKDMYQFIKDKKIKFNINNDEGIYIKGDFNWLKEALINIVKNCIEHTPMKGTIDIDYDDNPLYVKITVKDSGEGIDKKDIKHIFERFYKAKNSDKNSIGIGLSLSKSIINNHHGDIEVKSVKGKYTLFEIKFYKNII